VKRRTAEVEGKKKALPVIVEQFKAGRYTSRFEATTAYVDLTISMQRPGGPGKSGGKK
jgi:hypothetical protein